MWLENSQAKCARDHIYKVTLIIHFRVYLMYKCINMSNSLGDDEDEEVMEKLTDIVSEEDDESDPELTGKKSWLLPPVNMSRYTWIHNATGKVKQFPKAIIIGAKKAGTGEST